VIAHVPVEQLSDAFARLQATPQPPQFVSVSSGVSQPSPLIMLQSPRSDAQPESWQVPVAQLSPAPGRSQTVPQEPQFVRVLSGVSQPLLAIPSQLPKPGAHATSAQLPLVQVSDAFGRSHTVPQAPQLVSEVSGVSQPFASTESQLPYPEPHDAMAHMPVPQVAVALARVQATLQPPQSVSERSDRSQPLLATPSQSSKFALQVVISHVPVAQLSPAFGRLQATPQPPQLVSVVSEVSHPLVVVPSQLP